MNFEFDFLLCQQFAPCSDVVLVVLLYVARGFSEHPISCGVSHQPLVYCDVLGKRRRKDLQYLKNNAKHIITY